MNVCESTENYLETILTLKNRLGEVRSIYIASALDFSRPSVSVAMKKLRENEYISIDHNGYITLTESDHKIACSVYERHTLLSDCLIALGVDGKTAAEDACRIEHVISQESFEKIRDHVKRDKANVRGSN